MSLRSNVSNIIRSRARVTQSRYRPLFTGRSPIRIRSRASAANWFVKGWSAALGRWTAIPIDSPGFENYRCRVIRLRHGGIADNGAPQSRTDTIRKLGT